MKISRSEPGFPLSSAIHAGLLLAALVFFSDAKKFDDAVEMFPVEVVSDSDLTQIMKGEKTAREIKPTPRIDKVAPETETKPEPPLAEAKKDIATPPPSARPLPEPSADEAPPTPPKRVAALPPKPEPPPKPEEKQPEPKPAAKLKAAAPEPEKKEPEPDEAEVVKPKPPTRPKPDNTAKEAAAQEKPKERLKVDEVAKLLESKKQQEKPEREKSIGELAEKAIKESKPKSGEESAPKSKFDAASIEKLLSRETPQRRAATGAAPQSAALGAPTGSAAKMSASMEARIAAYIHDHYYPCWASGLSLGAQTYTPIVEFHLSREGELEGRPKLLNASVSATEHARGEQAVQAVRRCSPMRIPPEFMPYYEEALHEVTIRFQDAN
jgi:colicin import membrane protein